MKKLFIILFLCFIETSYTLLENAKDIQNNPLNLVKTINNKNFLINDNEKKKLDLQVMLGKEYKSILDESFNQKKNPSRNLLKNKNLNKEISKTAENNSKVEIPKKKKSEKIFLKIIKKIKIDQSSKKDNNTRLLRSHNTKKDEGKDEVKDEGKDEEKKTKTKTKTKIKTGLETDTKKKGNDKENNKEQKKYSDSNESHEEYVESKELIEKVKRENKEQTDPLLDKNLNVVEEGNKNFEDKIFVVFTVFVIGLL